MTSRGGRRRKRRMEGDEDEVNGKKDTREEKHKRTCVTKTGRRTGWDRGLFFGSNPDLKKRIETKTDRR